MTHMNQLEIHELAAQCHLETVPLFCGGYKQVCTQVQNLHQFIIFLFAFAAFCERLYPEPCTKVSID